jgi:hypothetical protein
MWTLIRLRCEDKRSERSEGAKSRVEDKPTHDSLPSRADDEWCVIGRTCAGRVRAWPACTCNRSSRTRQPIDRGAKQAELAVACGFVEAVARSSRLMWWRRWRLAE